MIVVCGDLGAAAGTSVGAVTIAARAGAAGAAVQVVGVVADDPDGDRRLLTLAAVGVGHVAVLRGPARLLEPADIDLALRYLSDVRVVVTVGLGPAVVAAAAEHASWATASLVVINQPDRDNVEPSGLPEEAIVLESPASDPDGTFAGFVGLFAARVDAGVSTQDAWISTTRDLAVNPV